MPLFKFAESNNEVWKDVKGFEGFYQVSNLGNVRSKIRKVSNGSIRPSRTLVSKGTDYQAVQLWMNNKGYNKLVHRLVAEAFIPNPDNLPEVNHKDKNPKNNCVENLEWVSTAYNVKHKNQNRDASKPCRRKVKCLETGWIFDSISAAGRSVGADATQIIESIINKRCCKEETFVYADELPEDEKEYMEQAHARYQNYHTRPMMKNSRKVLALETGQVFDSIAAAARFFECDTATINNRIKACKAFDGITLEFIQENT